MVIELHALYESLTGEGGADRRHVVAFHDAFSHLPNATVSLMVEYMNGGSLQDLVDQVGTAHGRILSLVLVLRQLAGAGAAAPAPAEIAAVGADADVTVEAWLLTSL